MGDWSRGGEPCAKSSTQSPGADRLVAGGMVLPRRRGALKASFPMAAGALRRTSELATRLSSARMTIGLPNDSKPASQTSPLPGVRALNDPKWVER
jgi:hypothetical protein